jgi:hypothetical protein
LNDKLYETQDAINKIDNYFNLEYVYLLIWSCLNEFIYDKFEINDWSADKIEVYPRYVSGLRFVSNSKTDFRRVKAKFNSKCRGFYIYKKSVKPDYISKSNGYYKYPSFLIPLYFMNSDTDLDIKTAEIKQYCFAYVSEKRNKLNLEHGNYSDQRYQEAAPVKSKKIYESVDLDDCMFLFKMVYNILTEKSLPVDTSGYRNNFADPVIYKSAFNVTGKLKQKSDNSFIILAQDNSELSFKFEENSRIPLDALVQGDKLQVQYELRDEVKYARYVFYLIN